MVGTDFIFYNKSPCCWTAPLGLSHLYMLYL